MLNLSPSYAGSLGILGASSSWGSKGLCKPLQWRLAWLLNAVHTAWHTSECSGDFRLEFRPTDCCSFIRFLPEYNGVLPRNRRRQPPSQSIIHTHSVIGDTWVTWKIIYFYNVLICDQATESQPGCSYGRWYARWQWFLHTICGFTALVTCPCFGWHCSVLPCR
jgi:hypothetical protein